MFYWLIRFFCEESDSRIMFSLNICILFLLLLLVILTFFFALWPQCLYLLAMPWGMWDLSSPTRGGTCTPRSGSTVLTTGPPGKAVPDFIVFKCKSYTTEEKCKRLAYIHVREKLFWTFFLDSCAWDLNYSMAKTLFFWHLGNQPDG